MAIWGFLVTCEIRDYNSMSQLVKITKHSSSINGSNTSSHESNISDSGQLQCWFPVAEDSGNLQNLEARQNRAVFLKS